MGLNAKYRNLGEEWALVTGAAGGIGLAMAGELAALGYNLVLVDVEGEKLHAVEMELHARHSVKTHACEMDLARRESAGKLHDWCAREGITPLIVVNNAGIFSYRDIALTPHELIETFTGLHVTALTMICRLFGADMAGRGRGWILNMSSYAAWMPWPGLAMYSATKGYIRNFSLALGAELREKGVTVTAVMPAGVTTGLYGLSKKWQAIGRRAGVLLTPERAARASLAAMFRGRRHYIPGFSMRLVLPAVRTLPQWAIRLARAKTLRFQK